MSVCRAVAPAPRPSRQAVREKLAELLCGIGGIPENRIADEAAVTDELRMESVALIEIQVAVEDEYDIEVDLVEVVERNEFAAIVDYIHELATRSVP